MYNEKMKFAQMIIHDIYRSETSTINFLCTRKRGWHVSEQEGLGTTSVDPMNIEELEEDEVVEQQSVEAHVSVEGHKGRGRH
jgi:hypothetical protein